VLSELLALPAADLDALRSRGIIGDATAT
jgi:hypothetical protein